MPFQQQDAGTFNQITLEGGANGCLLNDPAMSAENVSENVGLRDPVRELLVRE